MIECSLRMDEKRFQDLMEIELKRQHMLTRVEIFREVDVNGSYADFVVFSPYNQGLIQVYELKCYWDKDHKRLKRQVKDYLQVADVINVVVFGGFPCCDLPVEVNIYTANIRRGELCFHKSEKQSMNNIENNNYSLSRRICFLKYLNRLWKNKIKYADELIGRLERKNKKLQNKNKEAD